MTTHGVGARKTRPACEEITAGLALDKHARRGRSLGRGMQDFVDFVAQLANQGLNDPYEERARELMVADEKAAKHDHNNELPKKFSA